MWLDHLSSLVNLLLAGAYHVRILKATTLKRCAYLEGTKLFILPTACLADQSSSSYSVLSLSCICSHIVKGFVLLALFWSYYFFFSFRCDLFFVLLLKNGVST